MPKLCDSRKIPLQHSFLTWIAKYSILHVPADFSYRSVALLHWSWARNSHHEASFAQNLLQIPSSILHFPIFPLSLRSPFHKKNIFCKHHLPYVWECYYSAIWSSLVWIILVNILDIELFAYVCTHTNHLSSN